MNHVKCYQKDYPRPQFVRREWQSLNGEWEFVEGDGAFSAGFSGKEKIVVPFAPECEKSRIGRVIKMSAVWYSRKFSLVKQKGRRVHLMFEGCDYLCEVWVNGRLAGSHEGAYERFGFDITQLVKTGENVIAVRAADDDSCEKPRGKQRWRDENFGCWYVPTTGIYKTVWLDFTGDTYLNSAKMTPLTDDYSLRVEFTTAGTPRSDMTVETVISMGGAVVKRSETAVLGARETVTIGLNSMACEFKVEMWRPENPRLYDVEFLLKRGGVVVDTVGSYFGLREMHADGNKLMYNGSPIFLRLLLDQGYWPDSHLTPPNEEALVRDIELTKQMGYNGVRKHQKVEDERYLYYADIMGLFVWCEMPSAYLYSDRTVESVTRQWTGIVRQNYNHPSVVTWVVFNESWGVPNIASNYAQQAAAAGLYYLTKSLDPYRPVVSNDGWEHTKSDILTIHDYHQNPEDMARLYESLEKTADGFAHGDQRLPFAEGWEYEGQPIIFSEYGGTAFEAQTAEGWGYGNSVKSQEEFLARFAGLAAVFRNLDFCSGYCYTQITDVQQEVNGLLDENRKPKVSVEKIRAANLG